MVRAWHAGTVLLAQLAQRTKSMIRAPVFGEQLCAWASAGSLMCCACVSLIWPSCDRSCPRAESGLSSNITQTVLRLRIQLDSTSDLLLRSMFHAAGQPA